MIGHSRPYPEARSKRYFSTVIVVCLCFWVKQYIGFALLDFSFVLPPPNQSTIFTIRRKETATNNINLKPYPVSLYSSYEEGDPVTSSNRPGLWCPGGTRDTILGGHFTEITPSGCSLEPWVAGANWSISQEVRHRSLSSSSLAMQLCPIFRIGSFS